MFTALGIDGEEIAENVKGLLAYIKQTADKTHENNKLLREIKEMLEK